MPPKPLEDPRIERHNLKMTPKLKTRLIEAREKTGESMTGEIHSRLEATFDDSAQRITAVIWPALHEDDRAKFADLIVAMARDRKK